MRISQTLGLGAAFLATAAQAQMSSTNCTRMGATMVHCDTLQMGDSGSSAQANNSADWSAVFQGIHDRHVQKKIAKMINAGDCKGAYAYALEEGFDWAREVQQACAGRP